MTRSKLLVKTKKENKQTCLTFDPSITYDTAKGFRQIEPLFFKWLFIAKLQPSVGAVLHLIYENSIAFHKPVAILKTEAFLALPEIKDRQQFYKAIKTLKAKGVVCQSGTAHGASEYWISPIAFGAEGIHVGHYKNNIKPKAESEHTTSQNPMSSELTTQCSQNTLHDVVRTHYIEVPNGTPASDSRTPKESFKDKEKIIFSPVYANTIDTRAHETSRGTGEGVPLEGDQTIDDFLKAIRERGWGDPSDQLLWKTSLSNLVTHYPEDIALIIQCSKFMAIDKRDLYGRPLKNHPSVLLNPKYWPAMKLQAEIRALKNREKAERDKAKEPVVVPISPDDKVFDPSTIGSILKSLSSENEITAHAKPKEPEPTSLSDEKDEKALREERARARIATKGMSYSDQLAYLKKHHPKLV